MELRASHMLGNITPVKYASFRQIIESVNSISIRLYFTDILVFLGRELAPGFELRASRLQSRHSYCLRHSAALTGILNSDYFACKRIDGITFF
jgi:hypothetical protein